MKNLAASSLFRVADRAGRNRSVLAWPAWLRVIALVPAVLLLWLAVLWAHLEAAPW